jgi:hypothetical protein
VPVIGFLAGRCRKIACAWGASSRCATQPAPRGSRPAGPFRAEAADRLPPIPVVRGALGALHSAAGVWGRSRILALPLRPRLVDNADDALAPRMKMNVFDLHRLAVGPGVPIKCLDQVCGDNHRFCRLASSYLVFRAYWESGSIATSAGSIGRAAGVRVIRLVSRNGLVS